LEKAQSAQLEQAVQVSDQDGCGRGRCKPAPFRCASHNNAICGNHRT
jgi:hypothetical protein